MSQSEFMTIKELAGQLGIGYSTVARMARKGEIPCVQLGGRWLVPRSFVQDLLRSALAATDAPSNPRSE